MIQANIYMLTFIFLMEIDSVSEIKGPFPSWYLQIFGAICIMVFFIIVFLIIKGWFVRPKLIKQQALKRNGQVIRFGFWPQLIFLYKDVKISVSSFPGTKYQDPYTVVNACLPSIDVNNIEIYREKLMSKVGKKLGMQDIELGPDQFDREYIIKAKESNDENFIFNLLTPLIQNKLLDIRADNPIVKFYKNIFNLENE